MKPIGNKPGLVELVYDTLLDAISNGSLPPGERLAQEDIATRLEVSRQPVSHALALLKQQGLVAEQGKRGLIVAPLNNHRVRDLYQVRAALDALAARLAAAQVAAGNENKAALECLHQAIQEGKTAIEQDQADKRIRADVAFHSALYELSGNSAIAETATAMWPHFRRSMGIALQDAATRAAVWGEHTEILAAIEAGQPEIAEELARKHVARVSAEVWERLQDY